MKGYLLIFNTSSNKDAVKLNHMLFGRIISVPRKNGVVKYYKAGALDMIPHKRIIEGCYFSQGDVGFDDERLIKLNAELTPVREIELQTARGHWANHAKKHRLEVKNL